MTPHSISNRLGAAFLISLLIELLPDGVYKICSALAQYGIRVKDKAFTQDEQQHEKTLQTRS
jgi:hypothetical protein